MNADPAIAPTWQPTWSGIATSGSFLSSTPVTAATFNSDDVNLFAVGKDNSPYYNWLDGGSWQQNWNVVNSGGFGNYTPLTAVSLYNDTQLNLFGVGDYVGGGNGSIYTTWGGGDTWNQAWSAVGSDTFAQNTPIAAVATNGKQINLFALKTDSAGTSQVYTNVGYNDSWDTNWSAIGDTAPDFTNPTPIAALLDGNGQINLFAIGTLGANLRVYTLVQQNNSWDKQTWSPLAGGITLNQNTQVAATLINTNQLFVFVTDSSGQVYAIENNGGWNSGWTAVGTSSLPVSAPVTAVATSLNAIYLFAVASNGFVYGNWQTNGSWGQNWTLIGGAVVGFPPSSAVSATVTTSDQIYLALVDDYGYMYGNYSS